MSDSVTPWTAACQASLSFTISQSLLKLVSIESEMLSNHLILCCSLLLLSSIFPSISKALVTQLCPILSNPMNCSPPGSSVHGIFQARILESVAISYSRGSSRPRDGTHVSCVFCIIGGFFTTGPPEKPQTLENEIAKQD